MKTYPQYRKMDKAVNFMDKYGSEHLIVLSEIVMVSCYIYNDRPNCIHDTEYALKVQFKTKGDEYLYFTSRDKRDTLFTEIMKKI